MTRTISPGALEDRLGADLSALIRARNVALTKCTEITALPSLTRMRGAFVLEFADGSRLKGRRLHSAERAQTVSRLVGIAGDGFPQILERRGEALLIEWIEGTSLASIDKVPLDVLRRCGRMLGSLHCVSTRASRSVEVTRRDLLDKLERAVELLCRAQRLDVGLAQRTLQHATDRCPERIAVGIIHKDFCAENLVQDRRGTLFSVDNANLAIGPLDLDLARTWYRWPLSREQMSHFLAGYEEQRSTATFRRDFAFWAPYTLVMSAAARLRGLTADWAAPIERLGRLMDPAGGKQAEFQCFAPAPAEPVDMSPRTHARP